MTPSTVSTTQTDRDLDPFYCRDHAQRLRSEYLSQLTGRTLHATCRNVVLLAREGLSRLHQA